jgi:PAS domain-containing protein
VSVSTSETQSWVRPPESLESLGRCLFQSLDRETIDAFVCFLEWERGIFVHPAVSYEEEKKLLAILGDCDWKADPRGAFVRIFNHLGCGDHTIAERVRSSLITKDKRSEPLGAYAYLPKASLESASRVPENRVINPLLTEIVRCHLAIRKYSASLEERDYLFSAINRVGCMLLNRSKRKQVLAALLDLAVHLSNAEVGLLLVHDGEKLEPEIELGLSPEIVTEIRFLPERDSLLERVKATHRPVIIDDVSGPTIAIPSEYQVQIRGFVAIPFYIEKRLVGMMCLATGSAGRDMSTNLLETLETISAVMAIAVENDSLQRQLVDKGHGADPKKEAPGGPAEITPESWNELEHLRAAFSVADEGILIADSDGSVVYANPIAKEWVGLDVDRRSEIQTDPNSETRVLRWLKEQWRGGPSQRFLEVPFQKNSRVPMMATILRLSRSASYVEPGWVTFLRKQSIHIESSSNDQTVGILRSEVSKVQLAADLLRGFHDTSVDSTEEVVREARASLKRSCHTVQRLCEDLEDAESTRSNWVRRACVVSNVLRKAIDRVRPQWEDLEWERADFKTGAPIVVLGHPWQLRTALIRVIVEILQHADEPRVPKIQLARDRNRATITFEFSQGTVDPNQAARRFSLPKDCDKQGRSKIHLPSTGVQCAIRIFVRHGGRLTAEVVAADTMHVIVALPLAPDAELGAKVASKSSAPKSARRDSR